MVGRGLFLGVFFIAYAIQAITGFAGNIIAMPAGMATVGMQESVAMLNATGMIGCGLIAIQNWKHINWRELAIMLAVMTPFMFVGIWLDTVLPLGILSKIYGAIVVVVGVRGLVLKQQRFMPKWLLAVLLVLAGLIQGMFVSGGAILAIYALQRLQDKDQFRATLSCIWCSISCMPRCSLARGATRPIAWSWSPLLSLFCSWLYGSATSCRSVSARQRSSR